MTEKAKQQTRTSHPPIFKACLPKVGNTIQIFGEQSLLVEVKMASEEEKEKKRQQLREQARAMIHARPSSVLKDKMELERLQAEMEKVLEEEEESEHNEAKPKKPDPLQLKIKLPDGDLERITLAEDDTVPDIKEIIEDDHDVPLDQQQLFHKGKPLVDVMADLKDLGIETGDVIDLNPNPIEVFVQPTGGKKISMTVHPHITIEKMKQQIQDEHGLPADELKLEFGGSSLNDLSATLSFDCGVRPGDLIDLKPQDITVQIRLYTGKKLQVTLPPTTSVGELKKQVEKEHKYAAKEQVLEFDGKPLKKDGASLTSDCGIKNGAVIDMAPPDIKVSVVKHDGKKWSLTVKPTFTVGELKQMIQDKHEVPVEKQELEFQGKSLDDDSATLEKDYGIKAKSKIEMQPLAMKIYLAKHDGSKVSVSIKPTFTIGQLTEKLEDKHGIAADKHFLEFKGNTLDDPNATLEDCKIKADKTIDLKFKDINVTAIEPSGESIAVSIPPTANIFELQMKIQMKSILALEDHLLMFDGKALPDDGTISLVECNVEDGAVIKIDPRPVSIIVENVDGTSIELAVSPQETVDTIMELLENEYAIPVKEKNQTLYFNDEPLDHPDTILEAYGIQGGSMLFLDEPDIFFEVMVMPGGAFSTVQMKPTDALYWLKKKIQDDHEIPFRSQGLRIEGKKDLSATNPELTLQECSFEDGDVVVVESVPDIKIEIRINDTDGKKKKETMSIKVKHFYTVESLQIQLHEDFKIPRKEQVLKYDSVDLDDPMRTFKALGIGDGSIVDLHPWHVHVKTDSGDMLPCVLSPEATLYDLEDYIQKEHKIPAERISLSYKGNSLEGEPEATLSSFGIKYGETVDLAKLKKDKKRGEKPKKSKKDDAPKTPKGGKKRSSIKGGKKRESVSKSPKKDDKKDKKDKKRDSVSKSPKPKKGSKKKE